MTRLLGTVRTVAETAIFLQADHAVWLLIVYTKAKFDDLTTEFLAELKRGVEDAL